MCEEEDIERLNDCVPQEVIVKVLLRKIKKQKTEMQDLRHAISTQNEVIRKQEDKIKNLRDKQLRIVALMGEFSAEERERIKENPLYREILLLKREMKSVIKQKDRMIEQLIVKLNSQDQH